MTEKTEYRVEWDDLKDVFVVVLDDDDGISELGEYKDYVEAYNRALAAAFRTGSNPPEWDPELAGEAELDDEDYDDDELDEDDSPVFAPGTQIFGTALVVDVSGDPWWVDTDKQTLKRAG